jgi:hypothetical protein
MAFASGTLTVSDAFDNAETCTIGSKVYTFQDTLTNVDGNVLAGADGTATLANLKAAINLEAGAGTLYAAAMTAHPQVIAVSASDTALVVRAKLDGTFGNGIGTSETGGEHAWGAATLAGGTGDLQALLRAAVLQAQAGVRQAVIDLTDPEGNE